MGKIINFLNYTTKISNIHILLHTLSFILADKGYRVLLIDADSQMNLTAAIYDLSEGVEYSTNEILKWIKNVQEYISIFEYINAELKNEPSTKTIFRANSRGTYIDFIYGSSNLANMEADLYGIIKNKNEFIRGIPYKFEQALKKNKEKYDFILINTSYNENIIINGLIMMASDYFITSTSPTIFSLQAIDNLSSIFNNWIKLLGEYQTTQSFQGISFKPKFLGLIAQIARRFNESGIVSEKWIEDVNTSVKRFQEFAIQRGMSISASEFKNIFGNNLTPFIFYSELIILNGIKNIL